MTDDLVQRLRRTYRKEYAPTGSIAGDNSNKPFPFPILATEVLFNPDGREAADRIEALEAEIERLRERVKRVENNNRELRGSKERVYAATDLRQPTQSDALQADALDFGNELIFACAGLRHEPIGTEAIFSVTWDGFPYHVTIRAALQEQSK